ncbi:hypothetical protein BpHYR1_005868 [Brachionus plicatilis]|uniref:Uncharacterized protein n=1 Tax=Brachionus plicatilis TaxID=10195 RepID=A0A3M7T9W4_BRAPC|nr:hypothetical protein BpHYR1_005868 [Brachionus plicatilis]
MAGFGEMASLPFRHFPFRSAQCTHLVIEGDGTLAPYTHDFLQQSNCLCFQMTKRYKYLLKRLFQINFCLTLKLSFFFNIVKLTIVPAMNI